jgi:hypothetical protein
MDPALLFPELKWLPIDRSHRHHEALLGNLSDGVRFSLCVYPTCYRRGPYRLVVEILEGPHHHAWGCFDAADQPLRWYHHLEHAQHEAQAIAKVLWTDRCRGGLAPPDPAEEVEEVDTTGCPDPVSILMYAVGATRTTFTDGLTEIAAHLDVCPRCRAEVAVLERDFAESLAAAGVDQPAAEAIAGRVDAMRREQACPDHEAIVAFVSGTLDTVRDDTVIAHVTTCERCELEVAMLRTERGAAGSDPSPALPGGEAKSEEKG